MNDQLDILDQLRERIPGLECIPGCTQCCGQVPWSEFEWNLLPYDDRRAFDRFSFKCSFCSPGGCGIHKDRPYICRIFGVTEGLPCPVGVAPETTIDRATVTEMTRQYINQFFKGESQ